MFDSIAPMGVEVSSLEGCCVVGIDRLTVIRSWWEHGLLHVVFVGVRWFLTL